MCSRVAAVLVALALGACTESSSTFCGDTVCPQGTQCATVTIVDQPTTFCVTPEQLAACAGVANGEVCTTVEPATCHDGVCLADRCGNALHDASEICDDGNTLSGDRCSALCNSLEICGNDVVDTAVAETCEDGMQGGAGRSHDGCSSTCDVESPQWTRSLSAHPGPRANALMTYDIARRRLVVFGGTRPPQNLPLHDVLEWDGVRWSRPDAVASPASTSDATAIGYDPIRERVVLWASGPVWERDPVGVWQLRPDSGERPDRLVHEVVYDTRARQLGFIGSHTLAWWDGSTWTKQFLGNALANRFGRAAAYDPRRGVVVAFGGYRAAGPGAIDQNDTWELHTDGWRQIMPAISPPARRNAKLAFDPITGELLLVGGIGEQTPLADTWSWNGQRWQKRADVAAPMLGHAMAVDETRGRVHLFATDGTLLEWDGNAWTTVERAAPQMTARAFHATAHDPLRGELVVFGGTPNDAPVTTFGDTWIWNGSWKQAASGPPARFAATLSYVASRGEMVLFGGCTDTVAKLADTWVWRDGTWSQKQPPKSPPPRCYHMAAYDEDRDRVVIFGGQTAGMPDASAWSWDGTTWTEEPILNGPVGRWAATMAFDRSRREIVLFGGIRNDLFEYLDDTWVYRNGTWTERTPAIGPAGRSFSAMTWDEARQRVVLFGGTAGFASTADSWEWDGTSWTILPTLASRSPAPRGAHGAVPSLDGGGITIVGGFTISDTLGPLSDVWRLRWESSIVVEHCGSHDTDGDGRVGCADPDCAYRCTPLPASSCGDAACNDRLEACYSCSDCGACAAICGDARCEGDEAGRCAPDCS